MLAEMYEHLKDVRPTHGLEIVFVSSDRDPSSFQQYFSTMPWQAIPYETLPFVKQSLNTT
jgi:nucleoredoxin